MATSTGLPVQVLGGELKVPLVSPPPVGNLPGGPSRLVAERSTFAVPATAIATRSVPLLALE